MDFDNLFTLIHYTNTNPDILNEYILRVPSLIGWNAAMDPQTSDKLARQGVIHRAFGGWVRVYDLALTL
jgi:hypothetical protein